MSCKSFFTLRNTTNEKGVITSRQHCNHCSSSYQWTRRSGTGTLKHHITNAHPYLLLQSTGTHNASADTEDIDTISSPASSSTSHKRPLAAAAASSSSSASGLESQASKKQKGENGTIVRMFAPSTTTAINKQAAIAFATNRLSFNLAASSTFRDLIDKMRFFITL
jgi:hypothetical protein